MKCLSSYLTSQPAYPFGSQLVRQWLEIEGGLHSPLPVQTPLDEVTDCNKQLPQSNQTVLPFRGTVSADKQECSRTGGKSNSLGFTTGFLVPKPNNRWRPILDLSTLNTFLNTGTFKMETPETIRTSLQAGEWVTSIDFKKHTSTYQFTVSPGSTCAFTSRVGPTSSKPFPLACPQLPWSSQWWPKRSNSWLFRRV